jgi:hypothetical protein
MRFLLNASRFALVAAFAPVLPALAQDVTITDQRTTPITTGTINNGAPGNIIISSTGQITVTTGSAVTLNSNNTITNSGIIQSNDSNNTVGVEVVGGNTGALTNNGSIRLLEDFTPPDSDSDGDSDGPFAQGTNRTAILLSGMSPFTGNLLNGTTGSLTVEGNNSFGIRTRTGLVGNLTNLGTISMTGDNSTAVSVEGAVTGNVVVNGTITAQGANTVGLHVGANVTGGVRVGGTLTVTGFRFTGRATTAEARARLDADDLLTGGPAVRINASVTQGVEISGIGLEDDADDDGDGVIDTGENADTDDDLTATIQSFGSAAAVEVVANAASGNVTLGGAREGFGLVNRGNLVGNGVNDGFAAVAVLLRTEGGRTLDLGNGFANDGIIGAVSYEASVVGVDVGSGVRAPTIRNRNTISVQANANAATHTAHAIRVREGATVTSVENTGTILSRLRGALGSAWALRDETGLLTTVTNSGTIQADVIPFEIGGTTAGRGIAIDLSRNTTGITLRQIAPVAFTDDDTIDNVIDTARAVSIVGDIVLGSGADLIEVTHGDIFGNIEFGAGADRFNFSGGGRFEGRLIDADNTLALTVGEGTLALAAGVSNAGTARFDTGSILSLTLGTTAATSSVFNVAGDVTFNSGSRITARVPSGLPQDGAITFLTAGRLVGANNVTGTISGAGVPFLYNVSINTLAGNPNALEARYRVKTADELGLNRRQAPALTPLVEAMRRDSRANAAFASLETADAFNAAYNQLLPNHASASAELAAIAIDQAQRVTTNRLQVSRASAIRNDSFWFQEIAYGVDRDAEAFGVDYRGYGFGLAGGIDGPLSNGGVFGLAAGFITSEVEEPQRRRGTLSTTLVQANAYLGMETAGLNWDFVMGGGLGQLSSERLVDIGPSFSATAEADWWGAEGHASAQVSAPYAVGDRMTIEPRAGLTYLALYEQDYEEEGAGAGINLALDSVVSNRLWADVAATVGYRFGRGEQTWTPKLSVGYRHDLIEDVADRTTRFVSGGSDFTLTDEAITGGGLLLGFGLDTGGEWSNFSVQYEGEVRDGLQRHSLNAAVRFRF